MSKFGLEKGTIHDRAADEQVAHVHVPGKAYNVADPVTKLIDTIGGGFFNEPKYYDTNRSYAEFMIELLSTGKIASTIKDDQGLTEQAREVLETATAVANGDTPEDLLIVAAWARDTENGLKLRTTPQIMLALAAAHPKTKACITNSTAQRFFLVYATQISYLHPEQLTCSCTSMPHCRINHDCQRSASGLAPFSAIHPAFRAFVGSRQPARSGGSLSPWPVA